jgi:hypothetical protein
LNHFGIIPHVFGVKSQTLDEFVVSVGIPTEIVVYFWFGVLGDNVENIVARNFLEILMK